MKYSVGSMVSCFFNDTRRPGGLVPSRLPQVSVHFYKNQHEAGLRLSELYCHQRRFQLINIMKNQQTMFSNSVCITDFVHQRALMTVKRPAQHNSSFPPIYRRHVRFAIKLFEQINLYRIFLTKVKVTLWRLVVVDTFLNFFACFRHQLSVSRITWNQRQVSQVCSCAQSQIKQGHDHKNTDL